MSRLEVRWIRGVRGVAVAGALALGAGGLVVQGGAAGAVSEHPRSPAGAVLARANVDKAHEGHRSHSSRSHEHTSHKSHGDGSSGHKTHKSHGRKSHGGKRRSRGELPKVSDAKKLSVEPVVHADKRKPPTKLLVKNLVEGTGARATRISTVKVKYVGADYTTGKNFTDITWRQGQAVNFSLHGQVIPGFARGIAGMRVGGRREIVIPPKLGYGSQAQGPIKANETLVFVVDLESVS